ncbi:MAG TPA: ATP-binding protein, partial [Pyrinomonadaceae bacterium]|nr:ATP-binding protein [Pyrinomonadaceae bacterium]
MDEQLLQDFLADAEELTEELFADIASLRARHGEGRARRELLGRVFRRVHTVKGTAHAAGLAGVGGLAHEFESLLEVVRKGRAPLSAEVLDAFEDAAEGLASSLSSVARAGRDAPAPPALVERLRRLASAEKDAPPAFENQSAEQLPTPHARLPADILQTLSEYERQRLREATEEGARAYVVAAEFDLATFDEQFRRLGELLNERGEIISTLPGLSAGAPDRVHFRIVYAAHDPAADLDARLAPHGATLLETKPDEDESEEAADVPTTDTAGPSSSASLAVPAPTFAPQRFVRVPLDALDELISSLHELFDETAAAVELRAPTPPVEGSSQTPAGEPGAGVRRRFLELEEKLIGLRMSPAGRLLERAARAAASAAREAGREVAFEIAGGDVSIDRGLADALADPLLHLARNAVAHGVEPAAERVAAGKPARGRVRLAASAEAGRVSLTVEDDGRGVDAELIARAARERGIVAPSASLTEREALRLIFRPGFSTAEVLSHASGRGVGLDAAERAVEALGGEILVRTRAGLGTSFVVRVPTTLALLDALTVRTAGHLYCLDAKQL